MSSSPVEPARATTLSPRRAVALIVAAHALATATLLGSVLAGVSVDHAYPLIPASLALATAQATLVALVLALGGRLSARRWLAIFAAALGLTIVYAGAYAIRIASLPNRNVAMLAMIFALHSGGPLLNTALALSFARRDGWRWRDAPTPAGPVVRTSLRHLFAATVVAAVALGLARWASTHREPFERLASVVRAPSFSGELLYIAVLPLTFSFSAAAGAWASFGPTSAWRRGLATVAATALVGGLGAWFAMKLFYPTWFELGGPLDELEFALAVAARATLASGAVVASLGVLRLGGWRVDRPPSSGAPVGWSVIDA